MKIALSTGKIKRFGIADLPLARGGAVQTSRPSGASNTNPALSHNALVERHMPETAITKVCVKCKQELPVARFSISKHHHNKPRARCNWCRADDAVERKLGRMLTDDERRDREGRRRLGPRRAWEGKTTREVALWDKYKITEEQFDSLLERQGGACALCAATDPRSKHDVFHVDHCHETGRIRGLLCNPCNGALGKLGDTPQSLLSAYRYVASDIDAVHGEARNAA